jgi:hypothetical protein
MTTLRNHQLSSEAALSFLLIAIAGIISAFLAMGDSCQSCNQLVLRVFGLPLSGVAFAAYTVLFVVRAVYGPKVIYCTLLTILVAAHSALLSLYYRHACILCISVLLIGIALASLCLRRQARLAPLSALLFLIAVIAVSSAAVSGNLVEATNAAYDIYVDRIVRETPITPNKLCLHVFSSAQCPACRLLTNNYLPQLNRVYSDKLNLSFHEALVGMPIPTIAESWPRARTIKGLPDFESLNDILAADLLSISR